MSEFNLSIDLGKRGAMERLNKLIENGAKRVEIREIRKKRTLDQNGMFHGALTFFLSSFVETTGNEWTLEEVKILVKRAMGLAYQKHDQWFLRSTKDLNTMEFGEFYDRFVRWSVQEFGIIIPTVEEWQQGINPNEQ